MIYSTIFDSLHSVNTTVDSMDISIQSSCANEFPISISDTEDAHLIDRPPLIWLRFTLRDDTRAHTLKRFALDLENPGLDSSTDDSSI